MARGTQHRKRRPSADARVSQPTASPKRKQPKAPSWEDQLFFNRLRAHAKWVYVLLILFFVLGFVLLGVGSGSTGIGDVLQNFFNGTSSTSASLSSLQKKTQQHPKDAQAWRDLATKLEQKQRDDEAITALTQYTTLKPRNQDALLELAGIYLRRAQDYYTLYGEAQARSQALSPTPVLQPKTGSGLQKALSALPSEVTSAVSAEVGSTTSQLYTKFTGYLTQRLGVYQTLAKLSPKDATTQYELAQAARDAGDAAAALAAYKRFLVLAPDDSLAPAARKLVKQLEASLKGRQGAAVTAAGG